MAYARLVSGLFRRLGTGRVGPNGHWAVRPDVAIPTPPKNPLSILLLNNPNNSLQLSSTRYCSDECHPGGGQSERHVAEAYL